MIRTFAAILIGLVIGASSVWPAPDDGRDIHQRMVRRARIAANPMVVRVGVRATVFGYPGDAHAGGDAAYLGREIDPNLYTGDVCIAHRTIPGHTEVWITYRGVRVLATVCDKGPWGCTIPPWGVPGPRQRRSGEVWLCIYRDDVGDDRTDIDMSPRLAYQLGIDNYGRHSVTIEYQRMPSRGRDGR